jgi:eukaryotic-like serine/threonine-protein kinase
MSPGTTATNVTEFLRDLAKSQLFNSNRVDELFKAAPALAKRDSESFAKHLISKQILSDFQADKLIRGHWQGLKLGPYELLCPIGRGGMGIVYLARCHDANQFHSGRLVALKILPSKRANEIRTLARFHRESFIGLKLPSHPNLTRTLDAGESNGAHYLAMEYVPGRNLRQIVSTKGTLQVGYVARIFRDVARGLSQAHRAGFVHRDLKPANIVILPNGQPKILDFGFALMLGEEKNSDPSIIGGVGYTVGTMDYLAPEQAVNAAKVTPLADLYSLGCCLYFALTGQHPFPGGTAQDKIRAHRHDTPQPINNFQPDLPDAFVELVEWCMAKRPEARPESMEVVIEELDEWADLPQASPNRSTLELEQAWLAEAIARWKESRSGSEEMVSLVGNSTTDLPQPVLIEELPRALPVAAKYSARKLTTAQAKLMLLIAALCSLGFFFLGMLLGWLSR